MLKCWPCIVRDWSPGTQRTEIQDMTTAEQAWKFLSVFAHETQSTKAPPEGSVSDDGYRVRTCLKKKKSEIEPEWEKNARNLI